jgi:hypothetical protein
VLGLIAAIVAAALVSSISIDLGPTLRGQAERGATAYLKRPMHIGRLSVRLFAGQFELDDVIIEGLDPADRPFLKAKRITVSMPWWTIVTGDLVIDSVRMTDWDMTIEVFRDGRHSLPRLAPSGGPPARGASPRVASAHGARPVHLRGSRRRGASCAATLGHGRARAQRVPRALVVFRRHGLDPGLPPDDRRDGDRLRHQGRQGPSRSHRSSDRRRQSVVTGDVDFGRWPDQTYQVRSRVDFPRMREIFFKNETWRVSGEGDFDGTFHIFKGGRELTGRFRSAVARHGLSSGSRRVAHLAAERFEVFDASSRFFGGRTAFRYELTPIGAPGGTPATFDFSYEDVDLAAFSDFLGFEGGLRLAGRASGHNLLQWPLGLFPQHRGGGELMRAAARRARHRAPAVA